MSLEEIAGRAGESHISPSAYETAILASIKDQEGQPVFPMAVEALLGMQNLDGSWGITAEWTYDGLINTLAAVNCLNSLGLKSEACLMGIAAVHNILVELSSRQVRREYGTIGFDQILKHQVELVEKGGIPLPQTQKVREFIRRFIDKPTPTLLEQDIVHSRLFTLECVAAGIHDWDPVLKFQCVDGSLVQSPSATAVLYSATQDNKARYYLDRVLKENPMGAPVVYPFDTYEICWVGHNYIIAGLDLADIPEMADKLDRVKWYLEANGGSSWSYGGNLIDLDDTSMACLLLGHWGVNIDPMIFKKFISPKGFVCFSGGAPRPISPTIHLLQALEYSPERATASRMRSEAINEIRRFQNLDGFWRDTWHTSKYYATAHAIIAGFRWIRPEVNDAITAIALAQDEKGSWGGTPEESAYALQALSFAYLYGIDGSVKEYIRKGLDWLLSVEGSKNMKPLWRHKTLYTPTLIVESVLKSAVILASSV